MTRNIQLFYHFNTKIIENGFQVELLLFLEFCLEKNMISIFIQWTSSMSCEHFERNSILEITTSFHIWHDVCIEPERCKVCVYTCCYMYVYNIFIFFFHTILFRIVIHYFPAELYGDFCFILIFSSFCCCCCLQFFFLLTDVGMKFRTHSIYEANASVILNNCEFHSL